MGPSSVLNLGFWTCNFTIRYLFENSWETDWQLNQKCICPLWHIYLGLITQLINNSLQTAIALLYLKTLKLMARLHDQWLHVSKDMSIYPEPAVFQHVCHENLSESITIISYLKFKERWKIFGTFFYRTLWSLAKFYKTTFAQINWMLFLKKHMHTIWIRIFCSIQIWGRFSRVEKKAVLKGVNP